jgi:hypothetical protein
VFDLVAHEHDVAGALGRTGDRSSSGVEASLVAASLLLADDLRAAGLGAVGLSTGGRSWVVGEGAPVATLTAPAWELSRALVGRRTAEQLRSLTWTGDPEPVIAVIAAHHPLPAAALPE